VMRPFSSLATALKVPFGEREKPILMSAEPESELPA